MIVIYLLSIKRHTIIARTLILLILFQAMLGLWTVTWKLHPVTVMLHLMGGFATALLLFKTLLPQKPPSNLDTLAQIIFFMIILQVLLGGWVSSNYAALICPDFPYCQGQLFPPISLSAFNIVSIEVSSNSISVSTNNICVHSDLRNAAVHKFLPCVTIED